LGTALRALVATLIVVALTGCGSSAQTLNSTKSATSEASSTQKSELSTGKIFVIDCNDYVEQPKELQLYCADGGQQLSKIMWAAWTAQSASGLATSTKNTCDPDCSSGNYDVRIATLLLSEPVKTSDDHMVFTKIVLKYDKPLSDGQPEEYLDLPTELTP
jgi:hypothetical protein